MKQRNKGYIIPVILVVLLLVLAGFFYFSSPPVNVLDTVETNQVRATSTEPKNFFDEEGFSATTSDVLEEVSTTTEEASTTSDTI